METFRKTERFFTKMTREIFAESKRKFEELIVKFTAELEDNNEKGAAIMDQVDQNTKNGLDIHSPQSTELLDEGLKLYERREILEKEIRRAKAQLPFLTNMSK
jgi:hypothetical protein